MTTDLPGGPCSPIQKTCHSEKNGRPPGGHFSWGSVSAPHSPILPDDKGRACRIAAGPALFMLVLKICLGYRSMAQKRARMVATSARVAVPWGASAPAPLPVITPVWVAQIMAFTAQSLTEAPSG